MAEPVASVGTRHTSVMWVAKCTESLVDLLALANSPKGRGSAPNT